MKRWVIGVLVGLLLSSSAYGAYEASPSARLQEIQVDATNNAPFEIPTGYGRLAGVAVRGEIVDSSF
jgi:hypothetical protein